MMAIHQGIQKCIDTCASWELIKTFPIWEARCLFQTKCSSKSVSYTELLTALLPLLLPPHLRRNRQNKNNAQAGSDCFTKLKETGFCSTALTVCISPCLQSIKFESLQKAFIPGCFFTLCHTDCVLLTHTLTQSKFKREPFIHKRTKHSHMRSIIES